MYKNSITLLRKDNNLKKDEIAAILKLDRTTYTNYEIEKDIIPIKHLNTLCNYFNVSIDYIFELSSEKNYKSMKKDVDTKLSAKRIKEFRKDNKLTQEKLAKMLNCSAGTIAGYEIGRYIIALPFLYTISKEYNISADYLLGKIDEPKYFK